MERSSNCCWLKWLSPAKFTPGSAVIIDLKEDVLCPDLPIFHVNMLLIE